MAEDDERESLMGMITGLAVTRVWLTVFQPTSQDGYQAATALFNDGAWFSIPTSFIEEHRDEVDTLGITACPAIDFHATFPQLPSNLLNATTFRLFTQFDHSDIHPPRQIRRPAANTHCLTTVIVADCR